MRRTSVLVPGRTLERLAERAHRRGTTISEEIRDALERDIEDDPNPNQGFLDLIGLVTDELPGPVFGSPEYEDEVDRALYRRTFNAEPS